MSLDLSYEEAAALVRLLRKVIDEDKFPLSSRVQSWRAILAKLRPEQEMTTLISGHLPFIYTNLSRQIWRLEMHQLLLLRRQRI